MTVSLIPDIPEKEREYFNRFYTLFSKLLAMDNIERGTIEFYKTRFNKVVDFLNKGFYEEAKKEMGSIMMDFQIMRDVSFFQFKFNDEQVKKIKQFLKL